MHPDYKQQDGCHNCKHIFILYEHDVENGYYCAYNAPKRPHCGSSAMCERFDHSLGVDSGSRDWDDWSDFRAVQAWGSCPNWELYS